MSNAAATSAESDRFGAFGGRYVPETLIPALDELELAYGQARHDPEFQNELSTLLATYVGRPSPLSEAPRRRISARSTLSRSRRRRPASTGSARSCRSTSPT